MNVRLPPNLLSALDAFIAEAKERDEVLSRPAAIRDLLAEMLNSIGHRVHPPKD